ncbi:MAG: polysaccharide biosynthesis tyrosine autokinase [bacterium]|nr:polysaccharide biosynthesis tyrosine autokinase [bacterium]
MKNDSSKKDLIGQILINAGFITHEQLMYALKEREKSGGRLGETLVRLGYISAQTIATVLKKQLASSLLVNHKMLESPEFSEFYRLQTSIKMALFSDDPIRSIMVTSAVPAEGKSFSVSYLAMIMTSLMNKRTLLIDADLRRPSIHLKFGLSLIHGLTDVLVDNKKIDECLHDTEQENLKVLTSGSRCTNTTALLGSQKMKNLVGELKERFDLLIFDSSPLYPLADSVLLSSYVDGTILVIKAGATRRGIVQRAVNTLKDTKGKILGTILNQVEYDVPKYDYY